MTTVTTATPANPPLGRDVNALWAVVLFIVLIALAALALYGVWVFWPPVGADGKLVAAKPIHFFGWERTLSSEKLFFVTIAFAGALGAMAHSIRSFSLYLGSRILKWSWVPFYLLKPVLGAVLATLMYLVLRGGLFTSSADQASPYGFAAIAALTGLFTDQAVEKLKAVAEEVFDKAPQAADALMAGAPEAVTGASEVAGTEATLHGTVKTQNQETKWFFEYGSTEKYGQTTDTITQAATTEDVPVVAKLTLGQLTPGSHYRLVAQNGTGTTRGVDKTFPSP